MHIERQLQLNSSLAHGSAISGNVGVNPSLTITAMAERAAVALSRPHPAL